MTTTEAAFLAAILDNPADDAPRLIYAGWLEENGQGERAEFIRVQIELAKEYPNDDFDSLPPGKDIIPWHFLVIREYELLAGNFKSWMASLPGPWDHSKWTHTIRGVHQWSGDPLLWETKFRRGFIASTSISVADWFVYADAIISAQPVEELSLATWPDFDDISKIFRELHYEGMMSDFMGMMVGGLAFDAEATVGLLQRRWPHIKFILPDAPPR